MTEVYLGIGANIGDRISFIEKAVNEIKNIPESKFIVSSSVYETEAWGKTDQDDFLNCVVEIYSDLSAETLLKKLKDIEKQIGRIENKKWSEREIDIDLLFYGNEIIENDLISIPHREIENRKFVLVPFAELNPDFLHPVLKKTIQELIISSTDKLNVIKYQSKEV